MNITEIVTLLTNSGLQNIKVGGGVVEFDDPSCIYTAFDAILNYGWVVIVVLTAIMLFGWGFLYIKNGVNINNVFNNAKAIILIFCILSAAKPIINVVYGENLFAKACQRRQVSLTDIQELLDMREKMLKNQDDDSLYEIFEVIDSGQAVSLSLDDDDD